jgi:tetratricopeptide (TPR) repeat protein
MESDAGPQNNLDQTLPTPVSDRHDRPAVRPDIPTTQADGKPVALAGQEQLPPPPTNLPPRASHRMPSWRMMTLLGILMLALIAVTSGFAGYRAGIVRRMSAQEAQVAGQLQTQFDLALQEIQAGQFNRAKQRLEYIIKLNPGYPGVTEKLAEVLLAMNSTATPTIVPTPTITPTPDLRGVEELFAQAQQYVANSDWSNAIDTLLSLRKADPNYQPIWIDGRLYVSLRNRGKDKILRDGDLEGGIYDLTLAERFGPLDAEAKGHLTWAELYLRGASFWELDWGQAVFYFAQIQPALPNLRDGSGMTATERLRQALIGYGDSFAKVEDWCNAQPQYEQALTLGTDPEVEEKLADAIQGCEGDGEEEEAPPAEETPLVTPATPAETIPADTTQVPTEAITEAPTVAPPVETATPEVPTEGPPAEATTPSP